MGTLTPLGYLALCIYFTYREGKKGKVSYAWAFFFLFFGGFVVGYTILFLIDTDKPPTARLSRNSMTVSLALLILGILMTTSHNKAILFLSISFFTLSITFFGFGIYLSNKIKDVSDNNPAYDFIQTVLIYCFVACGLYAILYYIIQLF